MVNYTTHQEHFSTHS